MITLEFAHISFQNIRKILFYENKKDKKFYLIPSIKRILLLVSDEA